MRLDWNFASVGDTEARLERAGFDVAQVWLERWTYTPSRSAAVRTCDGGLPKHVDRLPEELHDEFVDAVLGSTMQPLIVDYVRLNISAGEAGLTRIALLPGGRHRPRDRRMPRAASSTPSASSPTRSTWSAAPRSTRTAPR